MINPNVSGRWNPNMQNIFLLAIRRTRDAMNDLRFELLRIDFFVIM
jgi:hypothetical protein